MTMSVLVPVLAMLLAIGTYASPASGDTTTTISSDVTCYTRYHQYGSPVESIPTSTQYSCTTKNVTTTLSSIATNTVTPAVITITETVSTTPAGTDSSVSVRVMTVYTTTTASNSPPSDNTECTAVVTASVSVSSSNATIQNGTYTASKVKRTANLNENIKNSKPWFPGFAHPLGSLTSFNREDNIPFEVVCIKQETTLLITTVTQYATRTITAARSTIYTTTTSCSDSPILSLSSPSPETTTTTVTLTQTPSVPTPSSCYTTTTKISSSSTTTFPFSTTTTSFSSSTTTFPSSTSTSSSSITSPPSQPSKCAPSNLLTTIPASPSSAAVNITQLTPLNSNTTRQLFGAADASACCQLCVNTAGCAAMASDPSAGNCFLYFTEPGCGVAFRAQGVVGEGTGFVVQQGCGEVLLG